MNARLSSVMEKVDLLLLEVKQLKSARLHFTILHRFRVPGTECAPGEEVAAVYLMYHGHEYPIPLSSALRLLFDFLAKNARLSLNASQIAACFLADEFYNRHGANIASGGELRRRVARSAVRVYVIRIRKALALTFKQAGLQVDPRNVLASENTGMNEVTYRLRGTFDWLHSDHTGQELLPIR
jgi:hypothetical protein